MPGFAANARLGGVFGDRYARVVTLKRRKKRLSAQAAIIASEAATINGLYPNGTYLVSVQKQLTD